STSTSTSTGQSSRQCYLAGSSPSPCPCPGRRSARAVAPPAETDVELALGEAGPPFYARVQQVVHTRGDLEAARERLRHPQVDPQEAVPFQHLAALGPLHRRAARVDPRSARAQAERQRVRQREPTGMGGAAEQLLARRPLRVQPGVTRLTPQPVPRGARLELDA